MCLVIETQHVVTEEESFKYPAQVEVYFIDLPFISNAENLIIYFKYQIKILWQLQMLDYPWTWFDYFVAVMLETHSHPADVWLSQIKVVCQTTHSALHSH